MRYELLIYLLLLGLTSFNAYSVVNKWVDEKGQIHYSDQPPPGESRSLPVINIAASSPSAASGVAASGVLVPKTLAEREAEYKKNQKLKAEAEKKAAQQNENNSAKQKYCTDTRISLKTLEDSPRIAAYTATGERYYLDDAARQQRIEDAHQALNTNCNN